MTRTDSPASSSELDGDERRPEVAANMGGSLGSSINISTNAGAQLASDLGKGLIQGTSSTSPKRCEPSRCI
uniref:conjugative transposon protein TraM n=1 Tax=Bacteroides salyersiae TaxID=291644 RepID=UPI00293D2C36|nr:conjugative transposon protein TraM [Bacteroides salyersiae]